MDRRLPLCGFSVDRITVATHKRPTFKPNLRLIIEILSQLNDPMSSHNYDAEDASVDSELKHLVASVYQTCWNEFYEWEPKYCHEELRKLGENTQLHLHDNVWTDIEKWEEESNVAPDGSHETIEIHLGQQLNPCEVTVKIVKLKVDFPPVPPYEFCMPISRSINCIPVYEQERERTGNILWSHFCPFVDPDESFTSADRDKLLEMTELEWECQPHIDNDLDIILIETISRLNILQFDKIDDLQLLPRPILGVGDEVGILERWHFRSPMDSMPPNWTPLQDLPSYKAQTEPGELIRNWCSLCVEFECVQHIRSQGSLDTTMQSRTRPQMIKVDRPCGEDCIFNYTDFDSTELSTSNFELLENLLFASDALEWTDSCEIAKIIAKPCWQVYKLMESRLEEQQDIFHITTPPKEDGNPRSRIQQPNWGEYTPYEPCAHPGPCDDHSCSCKSAKGWCSTACRCSGDCYRRPLGCSCSGSCDTDDCVCRREGRECEPSQCSKCWSADHEHRCKNAPIQRREWRKTEVRRAEFGWGLFALETIRRGEYIINYTGDIYTTDTSAPRVIVAEYLNRNYNFGLGEKIDIDSHAAGNESRVINDHINSTSQGSKINCVVRHIWAAGDFHIVIFASKHIKVGEELFLSYGLSYWNKKSQEEPPEPPKDGRQKDKREKNKKARTREEV